MCLCKQGDQSVDHIPYDCKLHDYERDGVKAAVTTPDSWPVSKDKLGVKYYKNFKEFTNNILLNKE
jgi:hypothetical protein